MNIKVERELVVKAHENYRNLKKKFIELKEENRSLQNDVDMASSFLIYRKKDFGPKGKIINFLFPENRTISQRTILCPTSCKFS